MVIGYVNLTIVGIILVFYFLFFFFGLFVCLGLWPSQPNGVMLSAVS